jgi:hypothetical protein
MRLSFPTLVACAAWLLCSAPARVDAQTATPLSAGTLPAGKTSIVGFVGFPYLTVEAGHGLTSRFDLTLSARTAWADIQRLGLLGRFRFSDPAAASGFAVRLGADTWMGRPKIHGDGTNPWIDITGRQDLTILADGIYSWTTPRGTVMSAVAGLQMVGTRQVPAVPLGGVPPYLSFGPNLTFRVAAEVPHESGLLFAFDLGVDVHLNGFDNAVAMPAFSVGIGYIL